MKSLKSLNKNVEKEYLECERLLIFAGLMGAAGFLGAYTYNLRGGVFCNAQTANFVLLAMEIGKGNWGGAAYLIIPISSYFLGAVISEAIPISVRKTGFMRWDTILVGIEVIVTFLLGFLPESAPYQITQVAVNFICSMQYNTFRQAEGTPMATTFCTNHLRQVGIHLVKWRRKGDDGSLRRSLKHLYMLGFFIGGGIISTILCHLFLGKAIWGASIILIVLFIDLLHADLTIERNLLSKAPMGH